MDQNIEVSFDGFIGIFDNAFHETYINDVIEFFEKAKEIPIFQQKLHNHPKHDREMDEMMFSSPDVIQHVPVHFSQYFFSTLWEQIIPLYQEKFSVLGIMQLAGEDLKMKKIAPGGGFHSWHFESSGDYSKRKLVVQLYMNDIDEAGETEFLYQNKRIAPKKNRLLVWPADWTHTHRGNPPIGEKDKYILTTWLSQAPKG